MDIYNRVYQRQKRKQVVVKIVNTVAHRTDFWNTFLVSGEHISYGNEKLRIKRNMTCV